ncbi:hypothetical protein CYMTET_11353, partial [Cymbomonas tetramitiformis]
EASRLPHLWHVAAGRLTEEASRLPHLWHVAAWRLTEEASRLPHLWHVSCGRLTEEASGCLTSGTWLRAPQWSWDGGGEVRGAEMQQFAGRIVHHLELWHIQSAGMTLLRDMTTTELVEMLLLTRFGLEHSTLPCPDKPAPAELNSASAPSRAHTLPCDSLVM